MSQHFSLTICKYIANMMQWPLWLDYFLKLGAPNEFWTSTENGWACDMWYRESKKYLSLSVNCVMVLLSSISYRYTCLRTYARKSNIRASAPTNGPNHNIQKIKLLYVDRDNHTFLQVIRKIAAGKLYRCIKLTMPCYIALIEYKFGEATDCLSL